MKLKAYFICVLVCVLALSPLLQLQTLSVKAAVPEPEGPEVEIYADQFDDPDNYGSAGGVTIPQPWVQEGGKSLAKTSASGSAPSTPNMVKIDATDVLALPLDLTGYGNIKVSYYTRASSYVSGSILVEWSYDGGATWTVLEDFKPAAGAADPNKQKTWALDAQANNNPANKLRFRADAPSGNLYFDSVSITGQAIPGIPPAVSPVPIPEPVEQEPFIPPAGVTMYEDVLVGMAGNREIYASIAVPEIAPSAPMPAMVYIHGGGWNHGDRKQALGNISNYVLKRGYIGVALSYRLTPEAPFPAQIQDVKLGIRFLRAHAAQYFIDPSRIGVWGSSAGGHLASLLGTTGDMEAGQWITLDNGNTVQVPDLGGNGGWPEYSDKVQAVADWFGPADFTTEFANNYSSVTALLGGKKAFTVPNEARLAMPGTYASPDDPPFWIRHGDADSTIPYQNSVTFAGQLTAAGVQVVDFKLVPGQGHGFTGTASETANTEAWAFLDQYVKNRTVTEPIIYKPGYGPGGSEPGGTDPGSPAVQMEPSTWTMAAGTNKEFSVAVTSPGNPGTVTVTWSTYDSAVASVASLGGTAARVTAVAPGSTKIVATVTSSVYQQPAVVESVVTVTPADPNPPGQVVEKEIAVLTPTDDALIDNGSDQADKNYNSTTASSQGLFSLSSSSSRKKLVYFKYDISGAANPSYHYIFQVAAKKGSSNTDVPLQLYGITDSSWSETTLTWNNAPVKDLASGQLLGGFTVDADKGGNPKVYTVDVTDYVRSRLAEGEETVVFMLGDAANMGISLNIYSKEANGTSNPRPSLTVKEMIDLSSDTAPPYWPEGSLLKAMNLGTDFVDLQWPKALDDSTISHYLLYRNNEKLATLPPEVTAYNASGLAAATAYDFKVTAVDAAGKISTPLTLTRTTLAEPILPLAVEAVIASSSDGNIESNTIDNNSYTRWSASGDPWILFDLGEIRQVGYLGIGFYKGDARKTLLDIETSPDGVNWTTGFSGWSSRLTTALQVFDLDDVNARYVRITGHGNSDGSVFTSLTDVHIYPPYANGDTPVALVPYILPGPPPGAVPFTQAGLTKPDGSPHPLHTPNSVTGRTLNVLDFGANPADDGQDDRPAIQAAIDAAVAGDEVYIPDGVYNLTTSPDGLANLFLKSGVNIRGESESGTILKTSLDMIKNSTLFKSAKQHDFQISGMTLTSAWNKTYTTDHKSNNPDAGGPDSLIMIGNYGEDPSYNVTIHHVTVEKFRRMAIRIENSHDVIVRNSTFRNATDVGPGGSGYGVAIQGIPKVERLGFANDTLWNLVEDSRFEGPYLRHGALIQNVAHNNTIRNNAFIQTKLDAIDLHGELEYLNEISGNLVENILTGGAVGLGNTGGTAPNDHSKSGPGNLIRDNIIKNSREGVVVTMGTPDTVIVNNLIENTANISDASGINILNGPGTIIRGNTIRNNTADGYWAILLEHDNGDANANHIGEGDPENVRIEGNILTGNTNGIGLFAGKGIRLKGNVVESVNNNFYQNDGVDVVIEESSDEWRLQELTLSAGELTPAFAPEEKEYAATVSYETESVTVTAAAADPLASVAIAIDSEEAASPSAGGTAESLAEGKYTASIPLSVGKNRIVVKVTAENGDTALYIVEVTRLASETPGSEPPGSDPTEGDIGGIAPPAGSTPAVPGAGAGAAKLAAVDGSAMEQALKAAAGGQVRLKPDAGSGQGDASADGVRLDGAALGKLLQAGHVDTLVVETARAAYALPVKELDLEQLARELGTDAAKLELAVTAQQNDSAAASAAKAGWKVAGAWEFAVKVSAPDGKVRELASFNRYVKQTVKAKETGASLTGASLAVVRMASAADGSWTPEPVPFRVADGEIYIYGRGNNIYLLVENERSFADLNGHWARDSVERMAARMIADGTAPDAFQPDKALTRAELAAFLVRALGLSSSVPERAGGFTDVSGTDWFAGAVGSAAAMKLAEGYDDGSFRPGEAVSRQELAVMVNRAAELAGLAPAAAVAHPPYVDEAAVSPWAKAAVEALTGQGLLSGLPDGSFAPAAKATRAECLTLLDSLLARLDFSN
ncbi:S-layer homology domain-containing protein [Paenibacillus sp. YN15]|uniref:S-layer homology domain-containing protein n=1 Tax=Paenibacillus sp. YN15 TaxID=1742774 RepID=UPI00215C58AB|nr:S-layer homology domain-containing protein [Paenibacillus sp. YN15]